MTLENRVKPRNEHGWLSSENLSNNRKQLGKCQSHNYYVDVSELLRPPVRYALFFVLCFVRVFV